MAEDAHPGAGLANALRAPAPVGRCPRGRDMRTRMKDAGIELHLAEGKGPVMDRVVRPVEPEQHRGSGSGLSRRALASTFRARKACRSLPRRPSAWPSRAGPAGSGRPHAASRAINPRGKAEASHRAAHSRSGPAARPESPAPRSRLIGSSVHRCQPIPRPGRGHQINVAPGWAAMAGGRCPRRRVAVQWRAEGFSRAAPPCCGPPAARSPARSRLSAA